MEAWRTWSSTDATGFNTLITASTWPLARDLLSKMQCLGLRLEVHGITASMSAWRGALTFLRSLPEKKLRPNSVARRFNRRIRAVPSANLGGLWGSGGGL